MKKDLTFNELRAANKERAKQYKSNCVMDTDFFLLALFGEVGELCNLVKKEARDEVSYVKEIGKELADIVIYLDLLSESVGYDLSLQYAPSLNELHTESEGTIEICSASVLAMGLFKTGAGLLTHGNLDTWTTDIFLIKIAELASAYDLNLAQEVRNKFNEVSDRIGSTVKL